MGFFPSFQVSSASSFPPRFKGFVHEWSTAKNQIRAYGREEPLVAAKGRAVFLRAPCG
jgi:hypothetical protein